MVVPVTDIVTGRSRDCASALWTPQASKPSPHPGAPVNRPTKAKTEHTTSIRVLMTHLLHSQISGNALTVSHLLSACTLCEEETGGISAEILGKIEGNPLEHLISRTVLP